MKNPRDIALFDMDGTLCDYSKSIKQEYDKIKSKNDQEYRDYDSNMPIHLKNRLDMIRSIPGWWEKLEKIKLGFEILDLAKKLGFEIYILTKAPDNIPISWTEKVRWVRKHTKNTKIIMSQDKGVVYGKFLVDDYPPYAKRWLNARKRGIVIMPEHYYNKDFSHPRVIKTNGKNLSKIKKALEIVKKRIPGEPLNISKL
jgi:5'(3')-deoxyribonucleotidase